MNINDVKALGEYVVCQLVEEKIKDKKLDSGLIVPAEMQLANAKNKMNIGGEQKPAYLIVHGIGPKVPEDIGIKKGQEVAANLYDVANIFGDNKKFVISHYKNIMGVVDAER